MFPIWIIIIVVIIIIICFVTAIVFIKRRLSRSRSVHTLKDEEACEEKKPQIIQTVYRQTTTHSLPSSTPSIKDNSVSDDDDDFDDSPPEPPQEIRISLPLPPPTTSFFSDKMELLDGDHDLFDFYIKKKKEDNGFANQLQQKAASIKSTLRQSLRKSNHSRSSVLQMFSSSQATLVKKSEEQETTLQEPTIMFTNVVLDKPIQLPQESSTKTIVDIPQPLRQIDTTMLQPTIPEYNESPITPNPNLQEPVRAAKRVIRSASRKTRTRSVCSKPFEPEDEPIDRRHSHHVKGEHMTITSGSMRRFVNQSIIFDEENLPFMHQFNSARQNTRKSGTSATEITSWWDQTNVDNSQYKASLNTSIFGTLSKTSGSSSSLINDGNTSKYNSLKRGATLGRNTLKSIASSGINRSLKGLFDSSTKLNLDDSSQKMEIQDEQENLQVQNKNVRASLTNLFINPELTPESSTKYAVQEDDTLLKTVHPTETVTLDTSSSFYADLNQSPIVEVPSVAISDYSSQQQDGEINTVRRMLQDTWINNMKESGSYYSVLSDVESIVTTSTCLSPTRNKPATPLLQPNDDIVTGPEPSVSFSSSTVRTMVLENEPSEDNGTNTWSGRQQSRTFNDRAMNEERRGYYSTMRKDKKTRGGIPWMME